MDRPVRVPIGGWLGLSRTPALPCPLVGKGVVVRTTLLVKATAALRHGGSHAIANSYVCCPECGSIHVQVAPSKLGG